MSCFSFSNWVLCLLMVLSICLSLLVFSVFFPSFLSPSVSSSTSWFNLQQLVSLLSFTDYDGSFYWSSLSVLALCCLSENHSPVVLLFPLDVLSCPVITCHVILPFCCPNDDLTIGLDWISLFASWLNLKKKKKKKKKRLCGVMMKTENSIVCWSVKNKIFTYRLRWIMDPFFEENAVLCQCFGQFWRLYGDLLIEILFIYLSRMLLYHTE